MSSTLTFTKMVQAVILLLFGISGCFLQSADCVPVFSFSSATFSTAGLLISGQDSWSVDGTLVMLNDDTNSFDTKVLIQEICYINLTSCEASTAVDTCYCSQNDSSVTGQITYSLVVKDKLVQRWLSQKAIVANIALTNESLGSPTSPSTIVTMPAIYNPVTVTYQFGYNSSSQNLLSTQNATVEKNEDIMMKFCVTGLTAPYTVNIEIDGTKAETWCYAYGDTDCEILTRAYDFSQSSYTATLSYTETTSSRTGRFYIIITDNGSNQGRSVHISIMTTTFLVFLSFLNTSHRFYF